MDIEPVSVFQCSLCNVYFEGYAKAAVHLGLKHSDDIKSNIFHKSPSSKSNSNGDNEILIKIVEFPNLTISMERVELDPEVKLTCKAAPKKSKKKKPSPKSRAKAANNVQEIKLETLTASEIEALMNDLYNKSTGPTSTSTNSDNLTSSSKSLTKPNCKSNQIKKTKKIKPQISTPNKVFEEDNDDDEIEVIGRNRHYTCQICEITFYKRTEYKNHMKARHMTKDKTKYICPKCKITFPVNTVKKFNRHFAKHNNPNSLLNKRPKKAGMKK